MKEKALFDCRGIPEGKRAIFTADGTRILEDTKEKLNKPRKRGKKKKC